MKDNFPTLGVLNEGWLSDSLAVAASRVGIDVKIFNGKLADSSSLEDFMESCDVITYTQDYIPHSLLRNFVARGRVIRPTPELQNFGDLGDADLLTLVARSPHGQGSTWTPTEVINYNGGKIVATSRADSETAQYMALDYVKSINLIGVAHLGFKRQSGGLTIDSRHIGPSPMGVWSSEGARTDQFEQHVRALFDLPLGDTRLISRNVVSGYFRGKKDANLYRPYLHLMARNPDLKFEQYRSEVNGFRGHVTSHGEDLLDLRSSIEHALDFMNGDIDE